LAKDEGKNMGRPVLIFSSMILPLGDDGLVVVAKPTARAGHIEV